uniref:NADH-ubiquinone oxidoreductase chain 6 n=1 Tax=Ambystoma californiense TaxID=43107 RepID=Q5EXB5_AMBCA|nr:NADH dehydrogenase subunit 6 [Ambystoma californiense]AAT49260.1 NADH dehydrogenase subunit 6 [Ambystoma californiense]
MYFGFLVMIGMMIGMIAVASNPSPYFAAFGLVLAAICGCCMLVEAGVSFLSLILLLIYLGGMLVVSAYSASLAAEPYPEAWGNISVLLHVCFYIFSLISLGYYFGLSFSVDFLFFSDTGLDSVGYDYGEVGLMYTFGWGFLVASGWVLFLTLFVVLEVTRGLSRGSLRAV